VLDGNYGTPEVSPPELFIFLSFIAFFRWKCQYK
jgi:hypothetical protein